MKHSSSPIATTTVANLLPVLPSLTLSLVLYWQGKVTGNTPFRESTLRKTFYYGQNNNSNWQATASIGCVCVIVAKCWTHEGLV